MQNGGTFAALMKVAAENSRSSNQEALQAAKRREQALRQAREEQERKERAEREKQKELMLRRIEDAKRDEEKRRQREEEMMKKREELTAKRQQDAEQARYAIAGSSREGGSKIKSSSYIVVGGGALTREEKRMARDPLMADKLKARNKANATKKRKDGSRLPGGAVNVDGGNPGRVSSAATGSMSARARIAGNFAPTLTRLNTEKRDTRSIDEISRDLRRGKIGGAPDKDTVLSGEKAQAFGDWFGKKDKGKAAESAEPPRRKSDISMSALPNSPQPIRSSQYSSALSSKPLAKKPLPSTSKNSTSQSSLKVPQQLPASRKRSRERSSSLDTFTENDDDYESEEEERYAKRRPTYGSRADERLGETQRDMIWKLMGKDRRQYTAINVDSDDDMEVTGAELELEEQRSYRIAKREDAEAEAEERRRELEKKHRKAERDRRGA